VSDISSADLYDVAVVGGGPTAMAAALAVATAGLQVALVGPTYDPACVVLDRRTTALLPTSLEMLTNLGVWQHCAEHAVNLEGVRIADDRGGLLRAPEVLFRADELGLTSLGANVPNSSLNLALWSAIGASSVRRVSTAAATRVTPREADVVIELAEGGSIRARLAVAADGWGSLTRDAAKISTRTWDYGQTAIATTFRHARPHAGITTELHRRAGPLTTVPLPGQASSLVWVETPAEAARLMTLSEIAFSAELEAHLKGLLGPIGDLGPRATYPLAGLSAERMGANRIALVGESAHVIPPIGAQGLNLGLRDAAALAEHVGAARARGRDIGGPEVLDAYHAARVGDVLARTVSVDLLNRSLLIDFLPVQALRGLGLHLLSNISAVRRLAMRGGLSAAGPLPPLMRPNARPRARTST
jgi:2-octaprenyl-6-methoxyphenol hydroxylase